MATQPSLAIPPIGAVEREASDRCSPRRCAAPRDRLLTWCLVLCGANIAIRLWLAVTFPLVPKEAELLEWSRHLAWGYLEHPPLIAWLIQVCDTILPFSSLLNQRLGAVALGSAIPLLVYKLGCELFADRRVARWGVVLALCLPSLSVFGVILLPESCLIVFQLLFLLFFHEALRGRRPVMWYAAGFALGLTALSHILGILVAAAALLFLLSTREQRHWTARKEPYLAFALALLVYAPFLWWNYCHDWTSFRFQFWSRHGVAFDISGILEVCFEQLAHTFLLIVIPLFAAVWMRFHQTSPSWNVARRLLIWQSGLVLGAILFAGCVTQTHPQWSVCAYPPLVLSLAAVKVNRPAHKLMRPLEALVGVTAVILIVAGIVIPLVLKPVLSHAHVIGKHPSRGLRKAYHRLYEAERLAADISQILNQRPLQRGCQQLLVPDPHLASTLSFYNHQQVAYYDPRKEHDLSNQLYYLDSSTYETGVFVGNADVDWLPQLERRFSAVQYMDTIRLTGAEASHMAYDLFQVVHLTAPLATTPRSTESQTAGRF